jgi:hypothetical protein
MATGMTPADTGFLCPRPPPRSHARARALHPPRAGHHARTRYPRAFRARGHTRARQTEPRRGTRSRTRSRSRNAAPTRLRPCVGEQGVPPRLSRGCRRVSRAGAPRLRSSRAGDGRAAGEVQGAAGEVQGRPAAGAALGRSGAWEGVLACCGSGFVTPIREESSRGGRRLSGDSGGRGWKWN